MQITCKLLANLQTAYVCAFVLLAFQAQAQYEELRAANGSLSMLIVEKADEQLSLVNPQAIFQKYLKPTANISFAFVSSMTDKKGNIHQKYQQYYQGLLVEHGIYSLHAKDGKVYAIDGEYYPIDKLSSQPTLTESVALQRTLQTIGAEKYAWEDEKEEAHIKAHKEDEQATNYPKGTLLIWHQQNKNQQETYHLAYKFEIATVLPHHTNKTYYVSAINGSLLAAFSNSCEIAGKGLALYSGVKNIEITQVNTNLFSLHDQNRNIETRDEGSGNLFTNNSTNWFNGDSKSRASIAAHWGVAATHDYFQNRHQRNGFDGAGGKITNRVDWGDNNAVHEGNGVLTFGKSPSGWHHTSLDIVAHEWGHALCSKTSMSAYYGESGAINESLSDIWGATVRGGQVAGLTGYSWIIGQESFGGLRNMSNPKSKGHPDTYKGNNWWYGSADWGGVHTNSGVMNHWFYMLTVGKTGVNDKGQAYSVQPVPMFMAPDLVFLLETAHLSANDGYVQAAHKSLLAARELFGVCGDGYVSVWNAWYAAGVLSVPFTPPALRMIAFEPIVCNVNGSHTFEVSLHESITNKLIPNTNYKWQLAVGGRLLMNGVSGDLLTTSSVINITFMRDFSNPNPAGYWETLTVTALDCSKFTPVSYRFWVGKPDDIGELSSIYACFGVSNDLAINEVEGAESYAWYVNPIEATLSYSDANTAVIIPKKVDEVTVLVMAANRCSNARNTDDDKFQYTYRLRSFTLPVKWGKECVAKACNNPNGPCMLFTGYPNPASSSYTISSDSEQKTAFGYKVFNSGMLLTEGSSENGENSVLQVATWADGIYTILIQTENGVQALKLAVQKKCRKEMWRIKINNSYKTSKSL